MACPMHKCVIVGLFGPGSRTVVEVPKTEIDHAIAVAKHQHEESKRQREPLANKIKLGTKKVLPS